MNPFESITDDNFLYQMCQQWDNKTLLEMSQAYSRVYQVCYDEIQKRKHEYEQQYQDDDKRMKDFKSGFYELEALISIGRASFVSVNRNLISFFSEAFQLGKLREPNDRIIKKVCLRTLLETGYSRLIILIDLLRIYIYSNDLNYPPGSIMTTLSNDSLFVKFFNYGGKISLKQLRSVVNQTVKHSIGDEISDDLKTRIIEDQAEVYAVSSLWRYYRFKNNEEN